MFVSQEALRSYEVQVRSEQAVRSRRQAAEPLTPLAAFERGLGVICLMNLGASS
jgi:hypothetical protein